MNRIEEIETRMTEISALLETEGATFDVDALTEEVRNLKNEKTELMNAEAKKAEMREAIAEGYETRKIIIDKITEEIPMEERKITVESAEYRDAFYAMLRGNATEEQRGVLLNVDGSTDGSVSADALAIPKTLDTMIWDNIHSAHPVLGDVAKFNTGIILEVTKHTAISAGKASKRKDADDPTAASLTAENNTFVKVQLIGNDYSKFVELTYAQARMSQGALEQYLAQEIAADIGEALAGDIFAKMTSDAGTGRKVVKGSNGWFETIATALGTAVHAVNPVIYCSAANYYGIFGSVDTAGQPIFRDGVAIGAQVKIDSAVPSGTLAVVVDPSKFILNEVQGVMIETDRDVKTHKLTVSGYLRAEGCMRDNAACAYITAS